MHRYFIRLSYSGTRYNGWQSQPHVGTITVQSTIESALKTLFRVETTITGCGRTDTGVHAMDYIAHFDVSEDLDILQTIYKLNKLLPPDIAIHDLFKVSDESHARFDAKSRSYQYHLHITKTPFAEHSFFYKYEVPDIDLLNKVAQLMMQYSDFTSFCKLHADSLTNNCKITDCRWTKNGSHYTFYVTSDRFLRGMIRLMVGACLNVSRGKLSLDDIKTALEKKERTGHDWSVPANGLFLYKILY